MFNDYGYRQDSFDNDIDINITNENFNTNTNTNYNDNMNINANMMGGYEEPAMTSIQSPVIEPGRERVINRTFIHNVPHVCPINTRIINRHIYRHTYQPHYTCCEQNVVCQEQCGSCCNFN